MKCFAPPLQCVFYDHYGSDKRELRVNVGVLTCFYLAWVLGILSLERKRQESEDDHSPLSGAEVKKAGSCYSTLQYVFMAWCLDKYRDFTILMYPS
jgi:hypothetical protein